MNANRFWKAVLYFFCIVTCGSVNADLANAQEFSGTASGGGTREIVIENFKKRNIDLYIPDNLPAEGQRALVVILHGGLGNSNNVRQGLQMDGMADKYGFIIAYMNGAANTGMREGMQTWNAGECCGKSSAKNIDDVGYLTSAIDHLVGKYGVNRNKIFGVGHSNGAMMTERMMCQTGIYAAAVPISGPLMVDTETCPAAKGRRIMAIHGADDQNVPIAGGRGTKGISKVAFKSESDTQRIYERSGANFNLIVVPHADHRPKNIRDAMERSGTSMQEKIVDFFGLNCFRTSGE